MLTTIRRFFWKTDEEIALEESRPPKKDKWDYAIEQRQRYYEWEQIRIRHLQMEIIPNLEEEIETDKWFLEDYIKEVDRRVKSRGTAWFSGEKNHVENAAIKSWKYNIARRENELLNKKKELFNLKNPLGNRDCEWLNRI